MTKVKEKTIFIGGGNAEQTKISLEQARREGSLVFREQAIVVNIGTEEKVETSEVMPEVLFDYALRQVSDYAKEVGVESETFRFIEGSVSDHPDMVYRLRGGQLLKSLLLTGDVALGEDAKKAGASIEQVAFYKAVMKVADFVE